eukprot:CAMPEP_0185576066 /NCGR_PEP_ID=MMETSP0434-20130131/7083_1 /TAXON_ID=626734 ORGANISM="Favella taraikaensis, Strain Fe Narragansett Bay" /NCGR_SAMPLE_ID=MMETSP0434 /ASSEMBLY_ACC=CAM_ASM_000379 /LENGTH=83 /DNA_ID=CAMNT_0028193133 /DNA_START=290 /DNA_END=541 /DNA_ORIENTATION=+
MPTPSDEQVMTSGESDQSGMRFGDKAAVAAVAFLWTDSVDYVAEVPTEKSESVAVSPNNRGYPLDLPLLHNEQNSVRPASENK